MLKKYKNLSNYARTSVSTYGIILLAFAVIFPLQELGVLSYSFSGMLVPICAYIVMAISLNLTVGVLGELSLGHAGFMSVGAFSGAIAAYWSLCPDNIDLLHPHFRRMCRDITKYDEYASAIPR